MDAELMVYTVWLKERADFIPIFGVYLLPLVQTRR